MTEWEHVSTFHLPGQPKPKGRPRFTRTGHAYTPQATRDAEKAVVDAFELACPLWEPTIEDVRLGLEIYWKGKARADADNVIKLVGDALNKYAWADDRQIKKIDADVYEQQGDSARVTVSFWTRS